MRIVFMGTPEFAVASLEKIAEAGHEIAAVVTAPDRPAGRGQKIQFSAVKEAALKIHIPVLQPENLKNEDFVSELKKLSADLFVVVAFRMLPEVVWNLPPKGTINLHGSLLPQYRGAAPINWAVMNGEKETGVTTFFIRHEIDTGNILQHRKIEISESDNAGTVHDKLMITGAELLVDTLDKLEKNTLTAQPQEKFIGNKELKHAPKIFRDTCHINWKKSTEEIYNLIRGLSPYPAAWTDLKMQNGETINFKLFEAEKDKNHHGNPGNFNTDGKYFLRIYTSEGSLLIKSLQQAGKKRMTIEEFLRGYTFTEGCYFE